MNAKLKENSVFSGLIFRENSAIQTFGGAVSMEKVYGDFSV